MGRTIAMLWHASFSVAAGVLYFFFVLPRWYELMGDIPHAIGTVGRIAGGVLIALTALPVVFTLLRTRKPEYGTPRLALSLRTWSIVSHVLAGVVIVGTAISEIWLSLDAFGQWLFGIYGAAAAVTVLGIFGFYLSFVAESPPPPPKPLKAKKPKQRRRHRKKGRKKADEAPEAEEAGTEGAEAEEATEPAGAEAEEGETTDITKQADEPAKVTAEAAEAEPTPGQTEPTAGEQPDAEDTIAVESPGGGLRNRRPTGKGATSRRRKRSRGGVGVEG